MSRYEIIVDEQALVSVSDGLKTYIDEYKAMMEEAIRQIKQNNDDWNDEDFNRLLSAVNSFMENLDEIEQETDRLAGRINEKIAAIHKLHNIKI